MNAFIPENPRVVIQIATKFDGHHEILRVANNISPDLQVEVIGMIPNGINEQSRGLPFDSDHPAQPSQVLAHKK